MDKNQLKKAVQALVKLNPETLKSQYGKFLALLGVTHHKFIQSLVDALEKPSEDLGLSQEQLVDLAKRLNASPVSKVVFKKISPALQQKHPELEEQAGAGSAVSFTSTANVAKYPVPIGSKMLRRKSPARRK